MLKLRSLVIFVLSTLAIYMPFMGFRFLRMAGDDKVYVAQALEMEGLGHWFTQVLFGEPNYYKGPLHYLLLRLGFLGFGHTMWASVYMNLVLLLIAGLLLMRLANQRLARYPGAELLLPLWFVTSVGVYAHSFASQMEIELASLFAIGLVLAFEKGRRAELLFWLVAGLIGWVKSPLHSVFLGLSGVLIWLVEGELVRRLLSVRSWAAAAVGIMFCVLGHVPAFLLDRNAVVATYWGREMLAKGVSMQPWTVAVESTFGFYLFPLFLPALVLYLSAPFKYFTQTREERSLALAGLLFTVPSVAFFVWNPYRFENYNLPVISGLLLFLTVFAMACSAGLFRWLFLLMTTLTGLVLLLAGGAFVYGVSRFQPLPEWLPTWVLLVIATGITLTGLAWAASFAWMRSGLWRPHRLLLAALPLYLAFGSALAMLGEREMRDVRAFLAVRPQPQPMLYYNLEHNIWSEGGYLNLMIPAPVKSLTSEKDLKTGLSNAQVILVPGDDFLPEFKRRAAQLAPQIKYDVIPWKRWRTRGRSDTGETLWEKAWRERSLDVLTRSFYIIVPQK